MMKKEEFLGFITDALEQMVTNKGYSEVNFEPPNSADEYDYDDYDYEEEGDSSETPKNNGRQTRSSSVFNNQSITAQRRTADNVSD